MIRTAEIRVRTGSEDDAYFREALETLATVRFVLPRTNMFLTGRLTLTKTDDEITVYTITREDA